MRISIITLIVFSLFAVDTIAQDEHNFVTLFDGSNMNEWLLPEEGGFRIEDAILITDSYGHGGDLYTKESFGNFILRLEFMLSDVGNSGVFVRSDPANRSNTGFEVQLLAPWTPWRDDLHCTASLYGHIAVTNRPDETTGKWYQMEIICDRNNIAVSVDGQVCTIGNINEIESLRERTKSGHIGLQLNHAEKEGQWTKFKNIRIRDLDKEPDYVARGFGIQDSQVKKQAEIAALKMGPKIIGSLAFLMGENDPVSSSGAKQALFDITAQTSAPGIKMVEKTELASELQKQADITSSEAVKSYLIWLSGMLQ